MMVIRGFLLMKTNIVEISRWSHACTSTLGCGQHVCQILLVSSLAGMVDRTIAWLYAFVYGKPRTFVVVDGEFIL